MSGRVVLLAVLGRQFGKHALNAVGARLPQRSFLDDLQHLGLRDRQGEHHATPLDNLAATAFIKPGGLERQRILADLSSDRRDRPAVDAFIDLSYTDTLGPWRARCGRRCVAK
jgi:hypothetical protein